MSVVSGSVTIGGVVHSCTAPLTLPPPSSGDPDPTNTGLALAPPGQTYLSVPAQVTSGPGWVYDSRGWVNITGANAVLRGLKFTVGVNVMAAGVLIDLCEFTDSGLGENAISIRHANNCSITRCYIHDANPAGGTDPNRLQFAIKDSYGDTSGHLVDQCRIEGTSNGINIYSGLVKRTLIQNMAYVDSVDHVDCMIADGAQNLTFDSCAMFNEHNQTAVFAIYNQGSVPHNVTVNNCLIAGGGYTIYGGSKVDGQLGGETNIKITNNRFSTRYYTDCGAVGHVNRFNAGSPGNVWSGNTWADGPKQGQAV